VTTKRGLRPRGVEFFVVVHGFVVAVVTLGAPWAMRVVEDGTALFTEEVGVTGALTAEDFFYLWTLLHAHLSTDPRAKLAKVLL
jgi:hypothetical protein